MADPPDRPDRSDRPATDGGATTVAPKREASPPGPAAEGEEVAFLRRSLADLDAELAAGDLTPADHARLRDDYTARLAATLRGGPSAAPVGRVRGRRPGRTAGAALAVATFAVLAGVLVARASGSRTSTDTPTGSIRAGSRAELDRCLELFGMGSALEALRCYDGVLADEPSNAEALAYRGWALVQVGDARVLAQAQANLDAAVAAAPDYADARVFRAVLALRQDRPADAKADLDALDALDAPVEVRALVEQFQLRQRVDDALAAAGG